MGNTVRSVATPGVRYSLIQSYAGGGDGGVSPGATAYATKVQYNPSRQVQLMVDLQESLYMGRRAPVAEYGDALYSVVTFGFFLPFYDNATGQYADESYRQYAAAGDPTAVAYTGTPVLTMLQLIIANHKYRQWGCMIQDPSVFAIIANPTTDPNPLHPAPHPLFGHIGNLQATRQQPNNWLVTFTFSELDMVIGQ